MANGGETIAALLRTAPKFHQVGGEATSWASQRDILELIDRSVDGSSASLETGCGYSTVLFAAAGGRHTVVTPAAHEAENVRRYCAENGIDTANVRFAVGTSQDVLPTLAGDGALDFVYIDGAHRFPYPCIDWVYTEHRLKVGGLMLVDDVRIPTCRILHDFLLGEQNWRLDRYLRDTAIFRKVAETDLTSDWKAQSYNRGYPDWSFLPEAERPGGRASLLARVRRKARRLLGRR